MMIIIRTILLAVITMSCTVIYSARGADSVRRKEEKFMREMYAKLTEFSKRELSNYHALCKSIFGTVGQEESKLEGVPEEQELTEEFNADEWEDSCVLNPEVTHLQKRDEQQELNKSGEKHKKQCEVSGKEQSLAEKKRVAKKTSIADIVAKRNIGYSTIHTFPNRDGGKVQPLPLYCFVPSASKFVLRPQMTQKKNPLVREQIFPTAERVAFVREQQRKQVLALRAQDIPIQRDNFDELVYNLPKLTRVQ